MIGIFKVGLLRYLGMDADAGVRIGKQTQISPFHLQQIHLEQGVQLGKRGWIAFHSHDSHLNIGERTVVGDRFVFTDNIMIGKECLLSFGVVVVAHKHDLSNCCNPVNSDVHCDPIVIGDRCFIGCNAVILGGVSLGHDCNVGAGAIVTKSFPPYSVIAGNPAKLMGERFHTRIGHHDNP